MTEFFLKTVQKPLCNGRKYLALLPDNIHIGFQCGKKRAEYKPAFFACINQMVEGEEVSE